MLRDRRSAPSLLAAARVAVVALLCAAAVPAVVPDPVAASSVRTAGFDAVVGVTTPNQLSGVRVPAGLAYAPDGTVYVSEPDANRVLRFAPGSQSAAVLAGGTGSGSGLSQLAGPRGLALDAAGNLYVADTGNHRVLRFAAGSFSGSPLAGVVVAGGGAAGFELDQLDAPRGVAVTGSGPTAVVWVADTGNHRVLRWAPGATSGVVVAGDGGAGSLESSLWQPGAVAVGADETVWVADTSNHRIVRWAPGAETGEVVFGGQGFGSGLSDVLSPSALLLDPSGSLVVADTGNSRVLRFAPGDAQATVFAGNNGYGSGLDQLMTPQGLALVPIDGGYDVLVADSDANRVVRWSEVSVAGSEVLAAPTGASLAAPAALAADGSSVWVADSGNHRVVRFELDGSQTVAAGTAVAGDALTQLDTPSGVAVRAGVLYVSDTINNRVLRFDPGSTTGVLVAGGAGAGSALSQLDAPSSLVFDAQGRLYVLDAGNSRVLRFDVSGTLPATGVQVAGSSTSGSNADQLSSPQGIAVDAQMNVYVADAGNRRVVRWAPNAPAGSTIASAGSPTPLGAPQGIAVSATHLFVGDIQRDELLAFPLGQPSASQLSGFTVATPTALTVDPDGRLWVLDSYFSSVQTHAVDQLVTLGVIAQQLVGARATPSVTVSSNRPATLTASPSNVCSIDAGAVRALAPGVCTVTAQTAASSLWAQASASRSFAVVLPPTTTTTTTIPRTTTTTPTATVPPTTVPAVPKLTVSCRKSGSALSCAAKRPASASTKPLVGKLVAYKAVCTGPAPAKASTTRSTTTKASTAALRLTLKRGSYTCTVTATLAGKLIARTALTAKL
jgi:sugar lactone lactonase YvrE